MPVNVDKLKVKEVRLVQEMTGKLITTVIKEVRAGDIDAAVFEALALVQLRRTNPEATVEDAGEFEAFSIFDSDEEGENERPS